MPDLTASMRKLRQARSMIALLAVIAACFALADAFLWSGCSPP